MSKLTRQEALLLLGLTEGASADEIQAAFRANAMLVHPDRAASESEAVQAVATRKMQQLNEAKELLTRSADRPKGTPQPPPQRSGSTSPPPKPQPSERCTRCGATQPSGATPVTECVQCRRPRRVEKCSRCATDNKVWGIGRWRCASCGTEQGETTTSMTCVKCTQEQDVPNHTSVYSCVRCRSPLFRFTCTGCAAPVDVWGIGNWNCPRCRRLNGNSVVRVHLGAH